MEPIEWLRIAGPIVMALVILGGLWAMSTHKLGSSFSISMHIATSRKFYYLMGILLTVGGALFYSFLAFWLIPYYSLHPISYGLLVIAFIAQLGMSWVPDSDTDRKLHLTHFTFGGIVAVSMILFLVLLSLSIHSLGPISSWLVITNTIVSIIYLVLFTFVKSSHKHFLVYESVFIALFATTCFVLTLGI